MALVSQKSYKIFSTYKILVEVSFKIKVRWENLYGPMPDKHPRFSL